MKNFKKKLFLKYLLLFILLLPILIVVADYSSKWLFPEWNGSYDLGNNLYMMAWERDNNIIVYFFKKTGRTCYMGAPVIPHNSPREVYVKSAKANKRWIIVKAITTETATHCYYLIDKSFDIKDLDCQKYNCDSIIQSHIIKYHNLEEFHEDLNNKRIDLSFDD